MVRVSVLFVDRVCGVGFVRCAMSPVVCRVLVSVNVFSFLVVCVVAVLYGVACCCCAPSCLMFFFVSWLSMVQCSFYVWLVEDWVWWFLRVVLTCVCVWF